MTITFSAFGDMRVTRSVRRIAMLLFARCIEVERNVMASHESTKRGIGLFSENARRGRCPRLDLRSHTSALIRHCKGCAETPANRLEGAQSALRRERVIFRLLDKITGTHSAQGP